MQSNSPNDIATHYKDQGFYFPLEAFDLEQAKTYRRQVEILERKREGHLLGNKTQLNYPHVIFRFADEIVRNRRILDIVEAIIGPNIMVWSSTLFIKEPHSTSYVSWHQDLRYWGLDSQDVVSAWVALSPVSQRNGCMRFVPGSHKQELVPHHDTYADDNALTRGQEAMVDINDDEVVNVELKPGQVSFHHGHLLHASAPNHSDERRIGYTISYIAPHVRQVIAQKDFAMLVRGQDSYGHFDHVPAPRDDLTDEAMAWHNRILVSQNEAMYEGVKRPHQIALSASP